MFDKIRNLLKNAFFSPSKMAKKVIHSNENKKYKKSVDKQSKLCYNERNQNKKEVKHHAEDTDNAFKHSGYQSVR